MDPGRKSKEIRTAEFVAVGDTVLVESVFWDVESFDDQPDDWAEPWHSITFHLTRQQGDRTFTRDLTLWYNNEITVRNHLTSTS